MSTTGFDNGIVFAMSVCYTCLVLLKEQKVIMLRLILICLVCLTGCSSPLSALISPVLYSPPDQYKSHEQEIDSLYSSGQISAEKYIELKQELLIAKKNQQAEIQKAQIQKPQPQPQQPQLSFEEQVFLKQFENGPQRISTTCRNINGITYCD